MRRAGGLLHLGLGPTSVDVDRRQRAGELGPGEREAGIERYRLLVSRDRPTERVHVGDANPIRELLAPKEGIVGRHVLRRSLGQLLPSTRAKCHIERLRHPGCDVHLHPEDIDENMFAGVLETRGVPDPELLIRTSGELRVSNFLLWQIAYTELYITKTLWPDFRKEDLYEAIYSYQHRERRFGKVLEPNA